MLHVCKTGKEQMVGMKVSWKRLHLNAVLQGQYYTAGVGSNRQANRAHAECCLESLSLVVKAPSTLVAAVSHNICCGKRTGQILGSAVCESRLKTI